jgi:hypothetical protein
MKTPYIRPDSKCRKLVGVSRTTWYRLDKLRLLSPKIKIQGHDYHSYTQLIEAWNKLEEAPHV